MHWNVAPDALPGSARLVRVLDRWRNDCDALDTLNSLCLEALNCFNIIYVVT